MMPFDVIHTSDAITLSKGANISQIEENKTPLKIQWFLACVPLKVRPDQNMTACIFFSLDYTVEFVNNIEILK